MVVSNAHHWSCKPESPSLAILPPGGLKFQNSRWKTSNPGLFCLFMLVIRASRVMGIVTKSLKTKKRAEKKPKTKHCPGNLGNTLSGLHVGFCFMERERNKSDESTPACWQWLCVLMKGNYFGVQKPK